MNVAKGGNPIADRSFSFTKSKGNGRVLIISGHSHNDAAFVGCSIDGIFGIHRLCEHEKGSISEYDMSISYVNGDEVVYKSRIYACTNPTQPGEEFDYEKWVQLLDKGALPDDAVLLLWRNRDCFMDSYEVKGIKKIKMVPGTISEQSFDVLTIDNNNLIITKIGAGEDAVLPL